MTAGRTPAGRRHDALGEALRQLRLASNLLNFVACSHAEERGDGPQTEAEACCRSLSERLAELRDAVEQCREVVV